MLEGQIKTLMNEVEPLVGALFEFSQMMVKKNGNFLPHGAAIAMSGEIKMVAAMPEEDNVSSVEVLPLLQDGLRAEAALPSSQAVAVSESVFIGEDKTPAIKVLMEHRAGLCVAYYMPFKKRLFRGPTFGEIMTVAAEPEICGW